MIERNDILLAWQQVKAKKASGGIDRLSVAGFAQNLQSNIDRIVYKLQQQTYLPEAYLQIKIDKNSTEKRILGLATINDKIVQTAINNRIKSKLETNFLNSSYAYREGKGARKAVNKVLHFINNEKKEWLAKCDIDNFFDNINHQRLRNQLGAFIKDSYLLELIFSFVKMGYISGKTDWQQHDKGVPQGAVLSPLLANLYLSPLDQRMSDLDVAYVRYADDFVILSENQQEAKNILQSTIQYIETKLKLQLNDGAFVKHTQYGFKFLGVWITNQGVTLSAKKINKIKEKIELSFNHPNFPTKYLKQISGINNYYGRLIPQHILYALDEFILQLWTNMLLNDKNINRKKNIKKALKNIQFITDTFNQNKTFHIQNIVQKVYEIKNGRKIKTAEQAVKIRKKIYEQKASENTHLHISGYGISLGIRKKYIAIKEKGKKVKKFSTYNLRQITIASKATSISSKLIKFCSNNNIAIDFTNAKGMAYAKIYNYQSTHNHLWMHQLQTVNGETAFKIARSIVASKINNQIKLIKYFSKYAQKTNKEVVQIIPQTLLSLNSIAQSVTRIDFKEDYQNNLIGYEGASSAVYWHWVKLMIDEKTEFEERITKGASDLVNQLLNYGYAIIYRIVWTSVIKYGLHPELSYLHAYQKNKGTLIFDLIEPFRQPVVDRAVISLINRKTKLQNPGNKLDEPTKQKLINAVYDRLGRYDIYQKERLQMVRIIDKQVQQLKLFITGQNKVFKPYKTVKW